MDPSFAPAAIVETNADLSAAVARERPKLGNFIRSRVPDPADAEDLLQDVFQEFIQAYRLPEPIEQVSAWLFRVARNRIIDRFRRLRRHPAVPIESSPAEPDEDDRWDLDLPDGSQGPEALYARSMILDALQNALDELPPLQRDAFVAHEIDGVSFKDMAASSGTAVNTLLARKRSAVMHLRTRLQPIYDELKR